MVVTSVPRPRPARAAHRGGVLVVVGGLPGSGKTTLLRRLLAGQPPGVIGLDSEQVTDRLRAARIGVSYRLLRPLVHACHRVRVLRGIGGPAPVVVLTDPWTSPPWRAVVLRAARRADRSVRLALIDESAESARAGQAARGRSISPRAMRRHRRRWDHLLRSVGEPQGGAAELVAVVDRRRAGRLTLTELLGPRTA